MEINWRRADYNERKAIEDFAQDAVSNTKFYYIGIAAMWEFVIILVAISMGIMQVQGEYQILQAVIIGLLLSVVNIAICFGLVFIKVRRQKMIAEEKFLVADATVIDKHEVAGRRYDRGFYIKYSLEDGKEYESKTSENNYEKASLSSRVVAVNFNQDEYFDGMYAEFDIVVVDSNPV